MRSCNSYKLLIPVLIIVCILFLNTELIAQKTTSLQTIKLPVPTSQYAVGTSVFYLTDKTRKSPLDSEPKRLREMMVQVWYPAVKTRQNQKAGYLANPLLLAAMKKENYLNLQPVVLDNWQNIQTHAMLNAPFVKNTQKLPLLLFSPGFGMSRANYTSILEELASYGYVVAAIDHPYTGLTVLPDGRVLSSEADPRGPTAVVSRVESMAQDALFVLSTILDKNLKSAGSSPDILIPGRSEC